MVFSGEAESLQLRAGNARVIGIIWFGRCDKFSKIKHIPHHDSLM
jgi:hypothetical protein